MGYGEEVRRHGGFVRLPMGCPPFFFTRCARGRGRRPANYFRGHCHCLVCGWDCVWDRGRTIVWGDRSACSDGGFGRRLRAIDDPFLLWFPCGSSGLFLLGAGAHWLCGVASASFPAPCRAAPWTLVAAGRRRL